MKGGKGKKVEEGKEGGRGKRGREEMEGEEQRGRGMKGLGSKGLVTRFSLLCLTVVEQLLTIVLPRVKDFHNLLTRRPNVSCNDDMREKTVCLLSQSSCVEVESTCV